MDYKFKNGTMTVNYTPEEYKRLLDSREFICECVNHHISDPDALDEIATQIRRMGYGGYENQILNAEPFVFPPEADVNKPQ